MHVRKVVPVALLVLIPTYIILQDPLCAKYGNGVLNHYSEILHRAHITYINGTMITHGCIRDYSSIIEPGAMVATENGDTVRVQKVTMYAVHNDTLFVGVETPQPAILMFSDRAAVDRERPSLAQALPQLAWVDLEYKPALVYYWRLLVFLLSIIEGVLLIWVLIRFFRSLAPSFTVL